MSKYSEIWNTLSSVNCNEHVKSKNGLTFLSWAWAWGILMKEYPQATYAFREPVYFENGTCEVWVDVQIDDCTRAMWLPVMNYKNQSVPNPSSRDISDTRMRCLTKCLAMFGLGHYIYAGEDIPQDDKPELPADEQIKGCVNVNQLQSVWKSLSKADQTKFAALKDEMKASFDGGQ